MEPTFDPTIDPTLDPTTDPTQSPTLDLFLFDDPNINLQYMLGELFDNQNRYSFALKIIYFSMLPVLF